MTDKQSVKVYNLKKSYIDRDTDYVEKSDYDLLLQELKDYREALDKMITKSNGLSMWVRDETMRKNLFNYDYFLHDGLVFLYARQCEAESVLNKYKAKSGGGEV